MNAFRWLSSAPIPDELDLRHCGWTLATQGTREPDCIAIADAEYMGSVEWMRLLTSRRPDSRRLVLVSGVKDAGERATLLQIGFGDALGENVAISELDARAGRVAEQARWLPRQRTFGVLQLDLLAREAFAGSKSIGLNPREFSLLWRLTDDPDEVVEKQTLIEDVWRLGFIPETNSIAVHMSRLRSKLTKAGLQGLIETASMGGYSLRTAATHQLLTGRSRHRVNGDDALSSDYPRARSAIGH